MMKNKFWFTWAFAVAAMSSVSFADVTLYDGAAGDNFFSPASGPGGFAFADFSPQITDTGNSLIIDTEFDSDSNGTRFGGLGRDLSPAADFDAEAEGTFFRIEYRFLANNAATSFRIVLSDIDDEDSAQDFQYFVDPSFATPLDDGSGFSEQFIPIAQGDSVFAQTSFGFTDVGDDVANFGLRQWQIQSGFSDADRLHIEVRLTEIVTAGAALLGDFDEDGDVDVDDIDFYVGNIGADATGELAQLDLDGDSTVTIDDLNTHITTLVQPSNGAQGALIGDLNLDGRVNVLGDAFILVASLNSTGPISYGLGNINADMAVDVLGDAFALVANLGQNNDPPAEE